MFLSVEFDCLVFLAWCAVLLEGVEKKDDGDAAGVGVGVGAAAPVAPGAA